MIDVLFLAFMTGIYVKVVDLIADNGLRVPKFVNVICGTIYGFLIGYVIVNHPVLTPLWLGTVVGVMVCGKIDSIGHSFGLLSLLVFLIFSGLPEFSFILLLFFVVVNIFDEWMDNKLNMGYRPIVEIAALAISLISGNFIFLFAILALDIGYMITTVIGESYVKE